MSGRKNNELKELKTPSKKRRKTSQEESEYKKTMLENLNQNQEETKRIEREKEEQLKNSLFEAIMKEKSVERVKTLLEENKEIVVKVVNEKIDSDSFSLLHSAVGVDNLEIAKLLLENGADTTTTDDSEENCFHYAAFRGNLEMLKLLVKYTKDIKSAVNAHGKTGLSVLHRAAVGVEKSDKNWPIIPWLLEQGANPDYKAKNKFSKFPKEKAVEDIFSKDISYVINYQRIVEEFKKKQEKLKEKNKGKISFTKIVEGNEEIIAELSEDAKKKRKRYLEIQEEITELSKELELEKESLISEIGAEKIVEIEESDSNFVASIEVAPWK